MNIFIVVPFIKDMEHMKSSSECYKSVNEVIYNFAGRVENIF